MQEKERILSCFFEILVLKINTTGEILEIVINTKESLNISQFKNVNELFSVKEKFRVKRLLESGGNIRKKYLMLNRTLGIKEYVDVETIEAGLEKYICIKFFNSIQKKEAEYDRNVEKLAVLACKDPMTKILNREGFCEQFRKLIINSNREKKIGIIFLDMDDLKEINDNHGHLVGDKAIMQISNILENTVRKRDLVSRIGGDEFVIAVEEVTGSKSTTMGLAKRILKNISKQKKTEFFSTVSIGIHILEVKKFPKSLFKDVEKFARACFEEIGIADKAVYQAKKKGKNQISVSDSYNSFY
jgi:diguanylate cyclase (GGDEF)-like protein